MNEVTQDYIKKFQGKKIFMDFDGTLCEYRYNDHVGGDEDLWDLTGQTREELLFGDAYFKARPLQTVKNFLNNFDWENIYILGWVLTNNEIDQKIEWLKIHYPQFKRENIYFVAFPLMKHEVMETFCKKYNISHSDVVLIDDSLKNIRAAEKEGFSAYHVTSLFD